MITDALKKQTVNCLKIRAKSMYLSSTTFCNSLFEKKYIKFSHGLLLTWLKFSAMYTYLIFNQIHAYHETDPDPGKLS